MAATWTIPLCPIAPEGREAAWGGDLGRSQKAKASLRAAIVQGQDWAQNPLGANGVPHRARKSEGEQ